MTLSTKINLRLNADLQKALDLVTPKALLPFVYEVALTSGAGLNQANTVWSDRRTVLASTTDSLDLAGGGLLDALGDAFAPARIKGLFVKASSANTQNFTLGRPAANGVPWLSAAGDSEIIVPAGLSAHVWPSAAGIVVTAGTGDLIDIVNGAGSSISYDIVIFGASS